MNVDIERRIEQVGGDRHYRGYIKLAGRQFGYDLLLAPPSGQMRAVAAKMDLAELRSLLQLTISRDGETIELTTKEYGLFLMLLSDLIILISQDPRALNGNQLLQALQQSPEPKLGDTVSIQIALTMEGTRAFTPELRDILSASKFGCVFPTEQS